MHIIKGLFIACAVLIVFAVLPASGLVLEMSYQGTVTATNETAGTVTVAAVARYGCSYDANGSRCTWNPIPETTITGTVPAFAFSFIKKGDRFEGTILGGDGGRFAMAAALMTPEQGGEVAVGVAGDPSRLHTPIAGGYIVDTTTIPDCSTCSGTVCQAAYGGITIKNQGGTLVKNTVHPEERVSYDNTTDGSSVEVIFKGGTSSRDGCPAPDRSAGFMTGIQALPVFSLKAVPPIPPQPVPTPTVPTMKVLQNGETFKRMPAGDVEKARFSFVRWISR